MTDDRPPTPTLDVILSQRACRTYRDDPVPDADLARMIEAASHAPSAENRQPWIFVVVDDPVVRGPIDDLARELWHAAGRAHSEATLAPRFFAEVDAFMEGGHGGAPCLVVVAGDGRDGNGRATLAASVYPAIQNLLLAAAALGYGSTMTTLATLAPRELGEILGLPDGVTPMAVIPIGRRLAPAGPPRRRPVEEIAHRNGFDRPFPGPPTR